MPTALGIITRAMRLARVIGKGETLDSDEGADGLTALNAMLDSWQLERLLVYQIVQGSYTWPASTTSRTIGSGGNFSATRPHKIDSAIVRDSANLDYPLRLMEDRREYDALADKSIEQAIPDRLFYDPAYPLGVLYLIGIPSASITLKLNTWQTLQSFSALTTDLSLPPGYQRAIEYNLAIEFGPEFGKTIKPEVTMVAAQSKSAIQNINQPSMVQKVDPALVACAGIAGGAYNIFTDS